MRIKHRRWCRQNAPFTLEHSGGVNDVPHGYSGWLVLNKNGAVVKRYATEQVATNMIEQWHRFAAESILRGD
jgi:hypothetical protein